MSEEERPYSLDKETGVFNSIAGFYDFNKISIDVNFRNHRIVAEHESLHDKAIYETPYGILQKIIFDASKNSTDQTFKKNMISWSQILFQESQFVHERYATYLSIKFQDVKIHKSLIDTHPDYYKDFFHDLSEFIDCLFKSSYIQSIVASKFLEICLSPRLFVDTNPWSLIREFQLTDEESPEKRFEVLKIISLNSFPSLAKVIKANIEVWKNKKGIDSGFDFQEEESWKIISLENSLELDDVLEDLIRDWFYELCESHDFPIIRITDRETYFNNISKSFGSFFQFSLTHSQSNAFNFNSKIDDALFLRIRRLGDAQVLNSEAIFPRLYIRNNREYTKKTIEKFLEIPNEKFIISNSQNSNDKEVIWYFISLKQNKIVSYEFLSHTKLLQLLDFNRAYYHASGYFIIPATISVFLNSDNTDWATKLYRSILKKHSVSGEAKRNDHFYGVDRLFWYMGGDFFYWYDLLMSNTSQIEVITNLNSDEINNPRDLKDYQKIQLNEVVSLPNIEAHSTLLVFRSAAFLGFFYRLFPSGIATMILKIIGADLELGKLKVMENPEKLSFLFKYSESNAYNFWETF